MVGIQPGEFVLVVGQDTGQYITVFGGPGIQGVDVDDFAQANA